MSALQHLSFAARSFLLYDMTATLRPCVESLRFLEHGAGFALPSIVRAGHPILSGLYEPCLDRIDDLARRRDLDPGFGFSLRGASNRLIDDLMKIGRKHITCPGRLPDDQILFRLRRGLMRAGVLSTHRRNNRTGGQ